MSGLQLLLVLVIAGICGSIAELIVGFSPGGFLTSIVIGMVGAVLGAFLSIILKLPSPLVLDVRGRPFDLVWATVGSLLLLVVISTFRARRGRRKGTRPR